MFADVVVTWLGNIGSGVFWSFCFLLCRVCDSGVTGGDEGGISPGGAVSSCVGVLDFRSFGELPD